MKILKNLDLTRNQLLNAAAHVVTATTQATTPVEGQIIYLQGDNSGSARLTHKRLHLYTGAGWVAIPTLGTLSDGDLAADAAIAISKLAVDPLNRANHSGTQTAATISNLATTVKAYKLNEFAAPTGSVAMGSQRLTGLGAPSADTDAATKLYVDTAVQGLDIKPSVRVATVSAVAYTVSGNTLTTCPTTMDGYSLLIGDRVLVKDHTTTSANGIYEVTSVGTGSNGIWTRTAEADTYDELVSAFVFVERGATNADQGFVCTVDYSGSLGTTPITFAQFSGAGQITAGSALTKSGNTLSVNYDSAAFLVNGSNQLALNLGTSPGLYYDTGLKVQSADATIVVSSTGLKVGVHPNSGVIVGPSGLEVEVNSTGGLLVNSNGIAAKLDGTTLTTGTNGIKVSDTYAGNTSLTTLGTVSTGTWNATTIAVNKGGTGATTAAAARTNLSAAGKYVVACSAGTTTTVTHNLNSQDVVVSVREVASNEIVLTDVVASTVNSVTVTFAVSVGAGAYNITVVG